MIRERLVALLWWVNRHCLGTQFPLGQEKLADQTAQLHGHADGKLVQELEFLLGEGQGMWD